MTGSGFFIEVMWSLAACVFASSWWRAEAKRRKNGRREDHKTFPHVSSFRELGSLLPPLVAPYQLADMCDLIRLSRIC